MENYERLKQSILKNIQELSEFLIDNFRIKNYYDLIDYLVNITNFKITLYNKNLKLAKIIEKEIKEE